MKIFTPGTIARAADVNENFQELADAINSLKEDTGWVTPGLKPINNWKTYGNGFRYRKIGKVCQIEAPIYCSGGMPNGASVVFNDLPEDIVPAGPITALGNASDATLLCLLSGRTLSVNRMAGNAASWFGVYMCYLVK